MKDGTRAVFALAAVAVTVGMLWYGNRPVTLKTTSWEHVVAEAAAGGYQLIKTDELWEAYGQDPQGLYLVDTRQEWEYRTGHIVRAVNFPMEPSRWAEWRKRGALEAFLGPDKNRLMVFY